MFLNSNDSLVYKYVALKPSIEGMPCFGHVSVPDTDAILAHVVTFNHFYF
jgi:hypothetical protein